MLSRFDPERVCQICGGPIDKVNTIGICHRRPECRRVANAVHNVRYDHKRGRPHTSDNWRARRRGAKFNHYSDPHLVTGDDNYLDETAVEAAVSGARKVDLSDRERREAAKRLIRRGEGILTVSRHLDMKLSRALILIDQMGFEVRSDPASGSGQHLIKRKRKK